jgi:ferredoxin-type protein NapG
MSSEPPLNRRGFFRYGLREILKPIAKAVESASEVTNQLAKLDQVLDPAKAPPPASPSATAPTVRPPAGETASRGRSSRSVTAAAVAEPPVPLRPPGAIDQALFKSTCDHSGECVAACPARCISLSLVDQLPQIDVDSMPCVVCSGLYCMHACPSGALMPVGLADINMGTALWNEQTCLRSNGEDCTICIDECPLGSVAIDLVDGRVQVMETGCIGCGVCQNRCPTRPKSIVVVPAESGRAPANDETTS